MASLVVVPPHGLFQLFVDAIRGPIGQLAGINLHRHHIGDELREIDFGEVDRLDLFRVEAGAGILT